MLTLSIFERVSANSSATMKMAGEICRIDKGSRNALCGLKSFCAKLDFFERICDGGKNCQPS